MRTTINIHNDILNKLKDASETLNISTNDIIEMLLNMVISKNIFNVTVLKGVRYQVSDPEKNWRKFHVCFEPQVYEKGF